MFVLLKKFLSSVSCFMFSEPITQFFYRGLDSLLFFPNVKTSWKYLEEKSYLIAQGVSVSVLCVSGENLISVDS